MREVSGERIVESEGTANVMALRWECLACLKNSKEASIAGVEGARGQRKGDELREASGGG